jgi:hypothetical protein
VAAGGSGEETSTSGAAGAPVSLPTAAFHQDVPPSAVVGTAGAAAASAGKAVGGAAGGASAAGFFLKKLNISLATLEAAMEAREISRYNRGLLAL